MAALILQKKVTNGALFHDDRGNDIIRVERIRLSYPFLGTPSEQTDEDNNVVMDRKTGKPKLNWRTQGLLPKATHVVVKDLIKATINKLIADAKAKDANIKVPQDKWFLTNGDDKEDVNAAGHWVITASDGQRRPPVRNGRGELITDIDQIDQMFFGGCWAHLLIRPWYFNGIVKGSKKVFPKRISCNLVGVVHYRDDTPFGQGRIDETDAWEGIPQDDNDDGMGGEDDPDAL